jgi:hypothetical protein
VRSDRGQVCPCRFPPPWTVEETQPCFIVRDANKQALAFVWRRIAANIAKPELLRAEPDANVLIQRR